jgi:hypothetical protein
LRSGSSLSPFRFALAPLSWEAIVEAVGWLVGPTRYNGSTVQLLDHSCHTSWRHGTPCHDRELQCLRVWFFKTVLFLLTPRFFIVAFQ